MVRLPLRLRAGGAGNGPVSYGVAEQGGVPALAVRSGGKAMAEPVRLGTLLTHPALWTPEERNNIRYQIGRGFYSPHAYQLFGLVASRGQTYVGIRWFAPAASNPQPLVGYVVARIRMRGRSLELTVVRAGGAAEVGGLNMVVGLTRYSPVPALTRSAAGNLVVTDARGRFRYVPPAEWVKVGPPPAEAR
ncbi:MAG TPA: hypothetical protein VK689_20760, partial [Armatimonadota bacterium]|nr:hypothetical protein [Armatimonadota bacterium]